MKRFISVVLVVVMILTVCATAFAANLPTSSITKEDHKDTTPVSKGSKTGSAAKVSASMTNNATFHFRVWRSSSYQASEGARITGSGSATLRTLKDDYGNSRLRKDYSYFLRVTHSTYSKVNEASCSGTWNP